jgi:hypothetical protein
LSRVLGQTPESYLHESKLALDHSERMFVSVRPTTSRTSPPTLGF